MTEMDPAKNLPNQPQPAKRKKRSATLRLAGVVLGLLLCGLAVLWFIPSRKEPQIVWLTPAEAAQALSGGKPGPLQTVRQSAKSLLAWVRHFYRSPMAASYAVQFQFFSVSPEADVPGVFGPPASTNGNGQRAWLVSAVDFTTLKQKRKVANGVTLLFAPTISVTDGEEAQTILGTRVSIPPTGPIPTNSGVPAKPLLVPAGYAMDIRPQFVPGEEGLVRLPVIASLTEPVNVAGVTTSLKMDFFTAARALVPYGGALVIECPNRDATNPTNYLMIVAPGFPPTIW